MNSISIAGVLGKKPELFTGGTTSVMSFSLADRQDHDTTIWWTCKMFGKRADALHRYLDVGSMVSVAGQIKHRKYTSKDGLEKTAVEVIVNDLCLMGGRKEAQPQEQPAIGNDDVPF